MNLKNILADIHALEEDLLAFVLIFHRKKHVDMDSQ
jgi:hypothetical protein